MGSPQPISCEKCGDSGEISDCDNCPNYSPCMEHEIDFEECKMKTCPCRKNPQEVEIVSENKAPERIWIKPDQLNLPTGETAGLWLERKVGRFSEEYVLKSSLPTMPAEEWISVEDGKLNNISSIVSEMLRYLERPAEMTVNGTKYVGVHCMKTTLEDINRELTKPSPPRSKP